MGKKGIGFGVLLIAIGVLAFLIQFGFLNSSVFTVFLNNIELTISLILIVTGINIIYRKYYFVKILTWMAFFIVMIIYGNYFESNTSKTSDNISKPFVIEQFEETGDGELKLEASAMKLTIGSTEENLIVGKAENIDVKHKVNYKDGKKTAIVEINTDSKVAIGSFFQSLFSTGKIAINRKCILNINKEIIWDMNMNLDAINSDLDLSQLKVKSIDIDGDAGNFKLKLGQKYDKTKVNIDADAAKVQVFVPVNSGVKVKFDGDASSTDFNDLKLERQGEYYVSKNYNQMDTKIELDVNMDAGRFEIETIEE
ncbi:MAG: hypothetical protein BWY74_02568 [Firmicutes bacterium ADurb.Bin419]|nr:MAG: hypothetical protein BWY74_02568 [Firmicutes bacterium ADurb.Bin419]